MVGPGQADMEAEGRRAWRARAYPGAALWGQGWAGGSGKGGGPTGNSRGDFF